MQSIHIKKEKNMCIDNQDYSLQDCIDGLIFKAWNMKIATNIIIAVIKNTQKN